MTETPSFFEIRNLVKDFPKVRAVDNVSFAIKQGTCFGLLGPNGAGKTTTIEIMEGIARPTSGDVRYLGRPLDLQFKQDVGIQFQSTALQEFQTCRETLVMFATLYRRTTPIPHLIQLCELTEFIDRDTHKISGGQRQRLLLAIALVNDPKIIFMDEPTTGLDPSSRHGFWNIVRTIREQGKTLVLTTHNMEEANILCNELIIMDHGRIIAQGRPHDLLTKYFSITTLTLPALQEIIEKIPGMLNPVRKEDLIEIQVTDVTSALRQLLALGIDLRGLLIHKPTLEDLFLQLTAGQGVV